MRERVIFGEPRGAACAGQSMQWRHHHRQPDQSRIRSIQTRQPRGLQVETRRVSSDFGLTAVRPRSLRGANSSGRTRSARLSRRFRRAILQRIIESVRETTLPRITSGITAARPASKSSGDATRLANCWHTKIYMTTWSKRKKKTDLRRRQGNILCKGFQPIEDGARKEGKRAIAGKMLIVPSDLSLDRGELEEGKFYLQFCV